MASRQNLVTCGWPTGSMISGGIRVCAQSSWSSCRSAHMPPRKMGTPHSLVLKDRISPWILLHSPLPRTWWTQSVSRPSLWRYVVLSPKHECVHPCASGIWAIVLICIQNNTVLLEACVHSPQTLHTPLPCSITVNGATPVGCIIFPSYFMQNHPVGPIKGRNFGVRLS
jgi:hypothetical protein